MEYSNMIPSALADRAHPLLDLPPQYVVILHK